MSRCPINYSFCKNTVTVYRMQEGKILRQVMENCLIAWEEHWVTDAAGKRMGRNFLLIVPGSKQTVFSGDRVYDGIGPEISAEEWSRFIPTCVEGLGQISFIKPYRWDGELCHVEAGNSRTARSQL